MRYKMRIDPIRRRQEFDRPTPLARQHRLNRNPRPSRDFIAGRHVGNAHLARLIAHARSSQTACGHSRHAKACTLPLPGAERVGLRGVRRCRMFCKSRTPSSCPSPLWGEGTQRAARDIPSFSAPPSDRNFLRDAALTFVPVTVT
jgi:hypothetical protein